MRVFLLTLLPALAATVFAADPPSKRGGLFGFRNPPSDQISSGLFPDSTSSSPFARGASGTTPTSSEGIFRSGQPEKVEATSYVIENGRKVEKPIQASMVKSQQTPASSEPPIELRPLSAPATTPVLASPVPVVEDKKRGGLFGFGKRGGDKGKENPVVTPVPDATPSLSASRVSSVPGPLIRKPLAAKPVESPKPAPLATSPLVADEVADTPAFAGAKEEKSGWLPFLNRKRADAPVPVAAEMQAAPPVASEIVAAPSPKPTSKPAVMKATPATSAPAKAKPADQPTPPEVASFEIRRDDSKPADPKKEEKTDREGGILTPITKIRPPKKEIDLSSAETVIQDGEIVGDSGAPFVAAPEGQSSTPRQAPQVVNGVKTYSSWDDVNASSTSAADRIINRIR